MATIDQLTGAIVTALNAYDFGDEFTAFENFVPRIERKSMGDGWHVWIVTADLKNTRVGRNRTRKEPSLDIAFIKRLANTDAATVNPCLALVDNVHSFVDTNLKLVVDHDLTQNEFDPLYSEEHLKRQSVFLSVLSLTYRRHAA